MRCTRCILPENFPNIKFNEEGICNYCLNYEPIKYRGESALRNLLNSYRNKGRKYDCIVGVSGGRDSSLMLYEIKEKYKMRVLAYNYDAGFTSGQAKENLKNMINGLDVDFVQFKSDIQENILKKNIIAWANKPSSELFPVLCYGCAMGSHGGAYKIARKMKIPLLITGRSKMEDSIFKSALNWNLPIQWLRYKKQLNFLHQFMKFMKNPFYLRPRNIYYYMLANLKFPAKGIKSDRYVKVVYFYDYIKHNKEDVSTIADKLEWKKPDNLSSSWRFDCKIHAIVNYMFKTKLGFSEADEIYSLMIRNNDLTRSEALRRIKQEESNVDTLLPIMEEVFEKINLPRKYRDCIVHC